MNNFSDLDKIFEEENSKMLTTLTLLVYDFENSNKNDLFMLARLLDEESLVNLINYFGGHSIKIPTVEEYENSSTIAFMLYLVDIKNMSFSEAKKFLENQGVKFNEHETVIGRKLSTVRQSLALKMAQVVEEMKDGTR